MLIFAVALAGLVAAPWTAASTDTRTVCTITVNSSDEAEAFRRALPAGRFRFVELVEKGRDDWLASACRKGVQCDVLIVSGHYDGEGMFFSDRVEGVEHLPVRELERVACSDSCPGLFDRLQQVYLFGCHTLAGEAVKRTWRDTGFGASHAPAVAARHGESSRDRMARIFRNVPVLYGFSAEAPLGPVAGQVLARYFRAAGPAEVAMPRPSARLLAHFAPHGMTTTAGITEGDPRSAHRRDVCQFADERRTPAEQAAFVHAVLQREVRDIVTLLDPLERFAAGIDAVSQASPDAARVVKTLREDANARDRLLGFARRADDPALRARLVALMHRVGWLSAAEQRDEWLALLGERLQRGTRPSDVDLACRLGREGGVAAGEDAFAPGPKVARDAMLACLGEAASRERLLGAMARGDPADLEFVRVVLEHRPIVDGDEFRPLAEAIARLDDTKSQARAFDALARHPLPDAGSATFVARLFAAARSADVVRALAAMLVRADLSAVDAGRLRAALREHAQREGGNGGMIDVLARRLGARDAP